jgi:F0F1-type ATP synthase delta subunit
MNMQLLKAADFNAKLHQRGCPTQVSVQRICKVAKDEKQVREILENVWRDPKNSEKTLDIFAERNQSIYEFEKMLEQK